MTGETIGNYIKAVYDYIYDGLFSVCVSVLGTACLALLANVGHRLVNKLINNGIGR